MEIWLIALGIGLGTFVIRLSFIAFFGRREVPAVILRALRFIPPAVLAALVAPAVLTRGGALQISPLNPQIWAALAAGLAAWRTRSVLLTILVGMASLWLLTLAGLR